MVHQLWLRRRSLPWLFLCIFPLPAQRRPPLLSLCGFSCSFWHSLFKDTILTPAQRSCAFFVIKTDSDVQFNQFYTRMHAAGWCIYRLVSPLAYFNFILRILTFFPQCMIFKIKYSSFLDFIIEVPHKRKTFFRLYSQNFDFSPLELLLKKLFLLRFVFLPQPSHSLVLLSCMILMHFSVILASGAAIHIPDNISVNGRILKLSFVCVQCVVLMAVRQCAQSIFHGERVNNRFYLNSTTRVSFHS